MFTALPLYAYSLLRVQYRLATLMDIAALGTFFMGVAVCFTLSTMYAMSRPKLTVCLRKACSFHTCTNHSKDVWIFANQLDYLGIVIVIWGSSVSSDFFGFYCDKKLQLFYWTTVSALLNIALLIAARR